MRTLFVDASHWLAIANKRDRLHRRAVEIAAQLEGCRFVTSELVLVEVLNALASLGRHLRSEAFKLTHAVLEDPTVEVVPQTRELFREALAPYRDRPDKQWSLTDCASFLIMERHQIADALTYDAHFEQNGYRALLRS